jgi:riboflavin synthase
VVSGTAPGDSIAVDGVCLTVVDVSGTVFGVDVMPESLARTALGRLEVGGRVNLERAVRADGRLDGHLVQGHVDGVGTLLSRTPGERWDDLAFGCPPALARYVAEKGSIAVSGVSLTVTWVAPQSFGVSLIPTTLARTTLGGLGVGDEVNLEVDVIAKYVERLLGAAAAASAGDAA